MCEKRWRGETLALTSGSLYQLEKSGETNFHIYFWTLDILPSTLNMLFSTLDILPSTLDKNLHSSSSPTLSRLLPGTTLWKLGTFYKMTALTKLSVFIYRVMGNDYQPISARVVFCLFYKLPCIMHAICITRAHYGVQTIKLRSPCEGEAFLWLKLVMDAPVFADISEMAHWRLLTRAKKMERLG